MATKKTTQPLFTQQSAVSPGEENDILKLKPYTDLARITNETAAEATTAINDTVTSIVNSIDEDAKQRSDVVNLIAEHAPVAGKALVKGFKNRQLREKLEGNVERLSEEFKKNEGASEELSSLVSQVIGAGSRQAAENGDYISASAIANLDDSPTRNKLLATWRIQITEATYEALNAHEFEIAGFGKISLKNTNDPTARFLLRQKINAAIAAKLIEENKKSGLLGDKEIYRQFILPLHEKNKLQKIEDVLAYNQSLKGDVLAKRTQAFVTSVNNNVGKYTQIATILNDKYAANPKENLLPILQGELNDALKLVELHKETNGVQGIPSHAFIGLIKNSGRVYSKDKGKFVDSIYELNPRLAQGFISKAEAFESERNNSLTNSNRLRATSFGETWYKKLNNPDLSVDERKNLFTQFSAAIKSENIDVNFLPEIMKTLATRQATADQMARFTDFSLSLRNNIYIDPDRWSDLPPALKGVLDEAVKGVFTTQEQDDLLVVVDEVLPRKELNAIIKNNQLGKKEVIKELDHILKTKIEQAKALPGFKDDRKAAILHGIELFRKEINERRGNRGNKDDQKKWKKWIESLAPAGFGENNLTHDDLVKEQQGLQRTDTLFRDLSRTTSDRKLNEIIDGAEPLDGESVRKINLLKRWVIDGRESDINMYDGLSGHLYGVDKYTLALRRAKALGIVSDEDIKKRQKIIKNRSDRLVREIPFIQKSSLKTVQFAVSEGDDQNLPQEVYERAFFSPANRSVESKTITTPYDFYVTTDNSGKGALRTEDGSETTLSKVNILDLSKALTTKVELGNLKTRLKGSVGLGAFGITGDNIRWATEQGIINETDLFDETTQKKIFNAMQYHRINEAQRLRGLSTKQCTTVYTGMDDFAELIAVSETKTTEGIDWSQPSNRYINLCPLVIESTITSQEP